jgi:diacylglycerol kinase (ATP)
MTGGSTDPSARIAVLCNPTAGRGRHRAALDACLDALRATALTVDVLDAGSAPAALEACRAAVTAGVAALVVAGGDGTVHLGVQAVAGTGTGLGVLPVGTGNDFADAIGLPASPLAAARQLATAVAAHRSAEPGSARGTRLVDLARVDGPDGFRRYFAAVLGAGFDALVNERANAMRWPKGRRRYDLAIFAELASLRPRQYTITLDGRTRTFDGVLVAVGNTASYGGGLRMCPAADPTDGLLDVVTASAISRTTLLRLQPKVYKGHHVSHPAVTTERARSVTIAADGITAYADGERMCPLPITVTAEPGALTLFA